MQVQLTFQQHVQYNLYILYNFPLHADYLKFLKLNPIWKFKIHLYISVY